MLRWLCRVLLVGVWALPVQAQLTDIIDSALHPELFGVDSLDEDIRTRLGFRVDFSNSRRVSTLQGYPLAYGFDKLYLYIVRVKRVNINQQRLKQPVKVTYVEEGRRRTDGAQDTVVQKGFSPFKKKKKGPSDPGTVDTNTDKEARKQERFAAKQDKLAEKQLKTDLQSTPTTPEPEPQVPPKQPKPKKEKPPKHPKEKKGKEPQKDAKPDAEKPGKAGKKPKPDKPPKGAKSPNTVASADTSATDTPAPRPAVKAPPPPKKVMRAIEQEPFMYFAVASPNRKLKRKLPAEWGSQALFVKGIVDKTDSIPAFRENMRRYDQALDSIAQHITANSSTISLRQVYVFDSLQTGYDYWKWKYSLNRDLRAAKRSQSGLIKFFLGHHFYSRNLKYNIVPKPYGLPRFIDEEALKKKKEKEEKKAERRALKLKERLDRQKLKRPQKIQTFSNDA